MCVCVCVCVCASSSVVTSMFVYLFQLSPYMCVLQLSTSYSVPLNSVHPFPTGGAVLSNSGCGCCLWVCAQAFQGLLTLRPFHTANAHHVVKVLEQLSLM